jgi:hypothetical protein
MPVIYPKFDKKIQEQIENYNFQQSKTRSGIISAFNIKTNTASVILDNPHTGEMGSILVNVPYPSTEGVQSVAPLLGTRCIVAFRGKNESEPYILSVYDSPNNMLKRHSKNNIKTGIPKFMVTK